MFFGLGLKELILMFLIATGHRPVGIYTGNLGIIYCLVEIRILFIIKMCIMASNVGNFF